MPRYKDRKPGALKISGKMGAVSKITKKSAEVSI
jgi:hypothetical protein